MITPNTNDTPVRLTIVVPSYNQASFLLESLREPLSYPGLIQVAVMDGGSTDGSLEIIERAITPPHIWRSGPDGGQAAAIKEGMERAQGEWLAFQNSDDFYLPGALGRVLKVIESQPRVDLIIGGAAACDEHGVVYKLMGPKPVFMPCMSQMNFLNNQSLFVRRSLLESAGPINQTFQFCLDYEWFVRLLRCRPNIAYIYQTVGVQRMHSASKTSNLKIVHDREFDAISARYFTPMERLCGLLMLGPYRCFRLIWGVAHRAFW